jgi:hypothetical protein
MSGQDPRHWCPCVAAVEHARHRCKHCRGDVNDVWFDRSVVVAFVPSCCCPSLFLTVLLLTYRLRWTCMEPAARWTTLPSSNTSHSSVARSCLSLGPFSLTSLCLVSFPWFNCSAPHWAPRVLGLQVPSSLVFSSSFYCPFYLYSSAWFFFVPPDTIAPIAVRAHRRLHRSARSRVATASRSNN